MNCFLLFIVLALASITVVLGQSRIELRSYDATATLGGLGYYYVYYPSNYSCSQMRYPVLYLLHGASGNGSDWLNDVGIQANLDNGINKQLFPPVLAIIPGFPKGWFVDSTYMKAESAFIKNLWSHVETTFADRLVPANTNSAAGTKRGRFIGGFSAGGFGTTRLTMLYPQLFASAFALSPAIYNENVPSISSAFTHPPFQTNGSFDISKWKSYNYVSLIDNYYAKNDLRPLFITSGDKDKFNITYEAYTLYWQVFRLRAGYTSAQTAFRIYDGDHVAPVWKATVNEAITWTSQFVTSAYVDSTIAVTDPTPCASVDAPSSTPSTSTVVETVRDSKFVNATIGLSIAFAVLVAVIVAMYLKFRKA